MFAFIWVYPNKELIHSNWPKIIISTFRNNMVCTMYFINNKTTIIILQLNTAKYNMVCTMYFINNTTTTIFFACSSSVYNWYSYFNWHSGKRRQPSQFDMWCKRLPSSKNHVETWRWRYDSLQRRLSVNSRWKLFSVSFSLKGPRWGIFMYC